MIRLWYYWYYMVFYLLIYNIIIFVPFLCLNGGWYLARNELVQWFLMFEPRHLGSYGFIDHGGLLIFVFLSSWFRDFV